jgi:hypothetical protein
MDDMVAAVQRVSSSLVENSYFGTSFCFVEDGDVCYYATCAHVIEDVGGSGNVRVGGEQATVVEVGGGPRDLAVLAAPRAADHNSLKLLPAAPPGTLVATYGYEKLGSTYRLAPTPAIIEAPEYLEGTPPQRIPTWSMRLRDGAQLKPGYSGGPVIKEDGSGVIAVMNYRFGSGERGVAISVQALADLLRRHVEIRPFAAVVEEFEHASPVDPVMIVVQPSRLAVTSGLRRTLYDVAGDVGGSTVFGRCQRLVITLQNQTASRVDVHRLLLRLTEIEKDPSPLLRYDKLVTSHPHARLPIEPVQTVRWNEGDSVGEERPLGEGWIRLEPAGTPEDTHQVAVSVEAESPGLWRYVVEAEYAGEAGLARSRAQPELTVLLRGR